MATRRRQGIQHPARRCAARRPDHPPRRHRKERLTQPGGCCGARPPPERKQTMQNTTDYDAITSRFYQLTEELSAGCDLEFDTAQDDLEREFQELRLLVTA